MFYKVSVSLDPQTLSSPTRPELTDLIIAPAPSDFPCGKTTQRQNPVTEHVCWEVTCICYGSWTRLCHRSICVWGGQHGFHHVVYECRASQHRNRVRWIRDMGSRRGDAGEPETWSRAERPGGPARVMLMLTLIAAMRIWSVRWGRINPRLTFNRLRA